MRHIHSAFLAFAVATAIYFGFAYDYIKLPEEGYFRSTMGVLSQISATLLGFMITALAVLLTLNSYRLIRNMQRTGHFNRLLSDFLLSSQLFGILTLTTLFASIAPSNWLHIVGLLVMGLGCFASFVFIETNRKFWLVLSVLHESINNKTELE